MAVFASVLPVGPPDLEGAASLAVVADGAGVAMAFHLFDGVEKLVEGDLRLAAT